MFTYCWGASSHEQLGLGDEMPQVSDIDEPDDDHRYLISTPREVCFFRRREVCEVACGCRHSVFLLKDGTVYTCGSNDLGQLGHNRFSSAPEQVTALDMHFIQHVACGNAFNVVTADNGTVLSWGDDSCGQCGWGSESRHIKKIPRLLKRLSMYHVIQVACGGAQCIALTKAGRLFAWGDNTNGQLGIGNSTLPFLENPTEIKSLHGLPILRVSCGGAHTFVVSVSGTIFGWGRNRFGQLGIGDTRDRSHPTLLKSLRSQRVKYIACGENHTAVLTADGGVFTFGAGEDRQLGHSSTSNEINPRKVFELMGSEVTQIACGRCHTLAFIPSNGRVLSFGLLTHRLSSKRPVNRIGASTPVCVSGPWVEGTSTQSRLAEKAAKPHGNELDTSQFCEQMNKRFKDTFAQDYPDWESPGTEVGRRLNVEDTEVHDEMTGCFQGMAKDQLRKRDGSSDDGDRRVKAIFSGGDHCFVLATEDNEGVIDHRMISADSCITVIDTSLIDLLEAAPVDQSLSEQVISSIEEVFSSAACLNASFLQSNDTHYGSTQKNHGVDLDTAREQFSRLANKDGVVRYMAEILGTYLIPSLPSSPPDIEALRLYLLLVETPVFNDPSPERYGNLVVHFGEALCKLTSAGAKVISHWWSKLQPRHLNRILTKYKVCMMGQLGVKPKVADRPTLRKNIKICLEVLNKLCKMNNEHNEILPYYLFYINELTENVGIKDHFLEWLQRPVGMEYRDVNFCDYPFVLNASAKTELLHRDATLQMRNAFDDVHRRNIQQFFFNPINPFLELTVDRNNLVQSTLTAIVHQRGLNFKNPLRVIFIGEEGLDAGGVRKEFFMLVLREILSPKFGMFRHFKGTENIWFNNKSFEDSEMFRLVGIIVGLAIYNFTIISLPFPLALYKKLLNRPAKSLDDLKQLDPLLTANMQALLDMEQPEEVLSLSLNFQITLESFGEIITEDLKPGGAEISVTMENRQEFVDSYVDYILNTSVEQPYRFFSEGFLHVCGGRVFNLFHPQELMDMVIGDEHYDWDEFEKNVEYKGVYFRQHPTIQMFWDVFRGLDLEHKKKFLVFLTGSDRVPIQGMKTLDPIIQPARGGEDFYPVAHTCFNLLDLPMYTDKENLKQKLLTAIEHTEGFMLV